MNPFDFIKNLQQMQSNMEQVQQKLAAVTATGFAGGDLVKVELNGQMDMVAVHLDPTCVDPKDVAMLEDLIRAAHSDAMRKIREKIKEEVGGAMPGLNLPGMA